MCHFVCFRFSQPSLVNLDPGSVIVFGANQPHAFRKMDVARELPPEDVFHEMRKAYVSQLSSETKQRLLRSPHVSLAWDVLLFPRKESMVKFPQQFMSQLDAALAREVWLRDNDHFCGAQMRSLLMHALTQLPFDEKHAKVKFEIVRRLLPSLAVEMPQWIEHLQKKKWALHTDVPVSSDDNMEDVLVCQICGVDLPFFFMMHSCQIHTGEKFPWCVDCCCKYDFECPEFDSTGKTECKIPDPKFEAHHKEPPRMLQMFDLGTFAELLGQNDAVPEAHKKELRVQAEKVRESLQQFMCSPGSQHFSHFHLVCDALTRRSICVNFVKLCW